MKFHNRLTQLERKSAEKAQATRGRDTVKAWIEAKKRGMEFDVYSGQELTPEQWKEQCPIQASRVQRVLDMADDEQTL